MVKIKEANLGEWYTPLDISEIATNDLKTYYPQVFGSDWVIWDNSAGEGAMTRWMPSTANIINSTIRKEDAENLKNGYQHDFINDPISKLEELFRYKKICIVMNPPYITFGDHSSAVLSHKTICVKPRNNPIANITKNTSDYFLLRSISLREIFDEVIILAIIRTGIFTGKTSKKSREWMSRWKIENPINRLYNASHFGCSGAWGVGQVLFRVLGKNDF